MPLQPLVRRDPQGANENPQNVGLPVNISNCSIHVDISKMASGMAWAGAGGATADHSGAQAATQGQGGTSNGWGLLSIMKSTVAAVKPTGQP